MKLTVKNIETQETTVTEYSEFYLYAGEDFTLPEELQKWVQVNHILEMPNHTKILIKSDVEEATFDFESPHETALFFACLPPLTVEKKRIVVVGKHEPVPKIDVGAFKVEEYIPKQDMYKEDLKKKKRPYYNQNRPF